MVKLALAVAGVCSCDHEDFKLKFLFAISIGIHMVVGANSNHDSATFLWELVDFRGIFL
jgi:hypothetical protein